MISFADITKLFSLNLEEDQCIEIAFSVKSSSRHQSCYMGKMLDQGKASYWYGLAADGSEAYDYDQFQAFSLAPVFDGRSLADIWDTVNVLSIDGCDPQERISAYLSSH